MGRQVPSAILSSAQGAHITHASIHTSCSDDAAHRTETSSQRIHARIFVAWHLTFFCILCLVSWCLHKYSRFAIQFIAKLFGINFGKLEESDTETRDEKTEDHSNQRNRWGFEAFVEDKRGDEGCGSEKTEVYWDNHGSATNC